MLLFPKVLVFPICLDYLLFAEMKKTDIPQDMSALENVGRELCYALDENGNYATAQSKGWEVKANALDLAWKDIENRIEKAKLKVKNGEASPLLFFMESRLMEPGIVSAYTGFWKWQIKRHLNPAVFEKLSERKLQKYAELFEISVEELKTMKVNEN